MQLLIDEKLQGLLLFLKENLIRENLPIAVHVRIIMVFIKLHDSKTYLISAIVTAIIVLLGVIVRRKDLPV